MRGQASANTTTGNQMSTVESLDLTPHLQFGHSTLEHVTLPDVSEDQRKRTDMERGR